jgi:hypothetical protein
MLNFKPRSTLFELVISNSAIRYLIDFTNEDVFDAKES